MGKKKKRCGSKSAKAKSKQYVEDSVLALPATNSAACAANTGSGRDLNGNSNLPNSHVLPTSLFNEVVVEDDSEDDEMLSEDEDSAGSDSEVGTVPRSKFFKSPLVRESSSSKHRLESDLVSIVGGKSRLTNPMLGKVAAHGAASSSKRDNANNGVSTVHAVNSAGDRGPSRLLGNSMDAVGTSNIPPNAHHKGGSIGGKSLDSAAVGSAAATGSAMDETVYVATAIGPTVSLLEQTLQRDCPISTVPGAQSEHDGGKNNTVPRSPKLASGSAHDKAELQAGQWRDLFANNRNSVSCSKLTHFTLITESQSCWLLDGEPQCETWNCCLIGYVSGKSPGFKALKGIIANVWKCEASLTIHDSGWLVYKFGSEEEKMVVLNGGPYLIFGRPLILRPMPAFFDFAKDDMMTVPVWVKLPNLPLNCWSNICLSKIASMLGKPIQCDRLTTSMERISYARVLVEVNLMGNLPGIVKIGLPNGTSLFQHVIYETLPSHCKVCRVLGHSTANCKRQQATADSNGVRGGKDSAEQGQEEEGDTAMNAVDLEDLGAQDAMVSEEGADMQGWELVVGKGKGRGRQSPSSQQQQNSQLHPRQKSYVGPTRQNGEGQASLPNLVGQSSYAVGHSRLAQELASLPNQGRSYEERAGQVQLDAQGQNLLTNQAGQSMREEGQIRQDHIRCFDQDQASMPNQGSGQLQLNAHHQVSVPIQTRQNRQNHDLGLIQHSDQSQNSPQSSVGLTSYAAGQSQKNNQGQVSLPIQGGRPEQSVRQIQSTQGQITGTNLANPSLRESEQNW